MMESTRLASYQADLHFGWRFWLRWVLANAFGFAVGFPLVPLLLLQTERMTDMRVLFGVGFLSFVLCGVSVGIMQWLALRSVCSGTRWLVATIVGWTAGLGVVAVLQFAGMSGLPLFPGMLRLALAYGAGAGMLQVVVLRSSIRRPIVWVLVSTAGWAAGWALCISLDPFFNTVQQVASGFASVFVIGAIVGGVSGMLTGLALLWLLRPSEHLA